MSFWDDAVESVSNSASQAWNVLRERFQRKQLAYRYLFLSDDLRRVNAPGEVVLADLARFCRAFESTAVMSRITGAMDPIASAKMDGRREVWLRIRHFIQVEEARLLALRDHQEKE